MRRHDEAESDATREQIEGYMRQVPCQVCSGARLNPLSLAVTIDGHNISDLCSMSIADAAKTLGELELNDRGAIIAEQVLKEINARLGFLLDVGLDYLSMSRNAATLAGEAQRIRLASQVGSGLVGVLYVLDEPSIGLHQRDNQRLIETLVRMRDLGNTVLVVEHDEDTMKVADHIVDIGPGAGEHGGTIVHSGTYKQLLKNKDSITGQYLSGKRSIPVPGTRRPGNGNIVTVVGAEENNLKDVSVEFPLGKFVCVTGVSGSGKSTLVNEILLRSLMQRIYTSKVPPGLHKRIEGMEQLDKVIAIDQSPIGRTPRSNPATYTGVFDHIRKLFAQTNEAKHSRLPAGPVQLQREGRTLRGLPRATARSRSRCTSSRMSMFHARYAREAVQPRHPRDLVQGQEHRRSARHADRGSTRVLLESAADCPPYADAGRCRPRVRAPRSAGPDTVGWRGPAGEAGVRARQAFHWPRSISSTSPPRVCISRTFANFSACSDGLSIRAIPCW